MKIKYLILGLLLSLSACSIHYSFYQQSNTHLKTVTIEEFGNESEKYELPQFFSDELTQFFSDDNRLKITADNGDLVIRGMITNYDRSVFSYNAQEQPQEWKVTVMFSVEAYDAQKDVVLWKNNSLRLYANYTDASVATSDISTQSEEEAWGVIVKNLGDMVLGNTLEQW